MSACFNDFSAQALSTVYVAAVSFGLSILLGRAMGPEVFGDYNFVLTGVALFMTLQDGGYRNLVYREGTDPTGGGQGPSPNLPALARGHALVVTLAGLAVLPWLPLPPGTRLAMAAALICFCCVVMGNAASSSLRAAGRFRDDALWLAALRTASALTVAATLAVSCQPWAIFAAWTAGLAMCLVLSRRFWPVSFTVPFGGSLAQSCWAFMLVEGASLLYHRVDILMLQTMRGSADTGQYAAAYRFLDGIILLAAPVGVVLLRRLRLARLDRPAFDRLLTRTTLILILAAAVLVGMATALGQTLIQLTFGADYAQAGTLLSVLFAALVFILPNSVLTQAAIADNLERPYALAVLICVGANVGLNWLLIPDFGAEGAAWATVTTEGLLCVLMVLAHCHHSRRNS